MKRKTTTATGMSPQKQKPKIQSIQIPRTMKLELKSVDNPGNSTLFKTSGVPPTGLLLNGVAQGAAMYQRVGNKIQMKGLQIRGNLLNAATCVEGCLRMVIVYDRQPNGALATWNTVFQMRDSAGTTSSNTFAMINVDQRERFVILRDKFWHAPSVTYTGGVQTNGPSYPTDSEWDVDEYIKLKGLKCTFQGDTSGIASISTGSILMFLCVNGTNDSYSLSWNTRLRYYDA